MLVRRRCCERPLLSPKLSDATTDLSLVRLPQSRHPDPVREIVLCDATTIWRRCRGAPQPFGKSAPTLTASTCYGNQKSTTVYVVVRRSSIRHRELLSAMLAE